MKILIVGRNHIKSHTWVHELWKQAIAQQHDVRFYGDGYGEGRPWYRDDENVLKMHHDDDDIRRVIERFEFEPDVIYTQWKKDVGLVTTGLAELDIPKVHYTTEYFHWNYKIEDYFIKKYKIDLVLVPNSPMVDRISEVHGIKVRLLPFSIDTDIFKPSDVKRDISISAVMHAGGWYSGRMELLEKVKSIERSYVFSAFRRKHKLYHGDYIDICTRSKMSVNASRVHEAQVGPIYSKPKPLDAPYTTFTGLRTVEIPACGALLLTQYSEDLYPMGFRHLENCIVYDDPREVPPMVNELLIQGEYRQRIAEAGLEHVRKHHSNAVRVQQFTKIIQEELGCED